MTAMPPVIDRETRQEQVDALRVREKTHTREGDAIAPWRLRGELLAQLGLTAVQLGVGGVTLRVYARAARARQREGAARGVDGRGL